MLAIQNWMDYFIQFWMFIVILSLYREINQKHPFLDDFDAISQIIQNWMIVGRQ